MAFYLIDRSPSMAAPPATAAAALGRRGLFGEQRQQFKLGPHARRLDQCDAARLPVLHHGLEKVGPGHELHAAEPRARPPVRGAPRSQVGRQRRGMKEGGIEKLKIE